MFTARFSSTPAGVTRSSTKTDRVKAYTNDVRARLQRPADNSNKKVFFVVNKTNEVRCWPYRNFLALTRQTHPGEVRLAHEADLATIHGDLDQYSGDVVFPQSSTDVFVDQMSAFVVDSAKAMAKIHTKKNKKAVKSERSSKKIKAAAPKKVAKKKSSKKIKK